MKGFCLAGLLAAAAAGCSDNAAANRPAAPRAAPVAVAVAQMRDVPDRLGAIATVEALETVAVTPQASGQIVAIAFKEGSHVRKGDLLFEIDAQPYQAALAQAEGALARDQAQAQSAAADAERIEQLAVEGLVSRQQRDQALAAAASQHGSAASNAAVVKRARLDLAYTQVRAPISGRTGSVLVRVGSVVKPGDAAPLVVINRIDPVYVSFSLPERRLGAVRAAQARGALAVDCTLTGEADAVTGGTLTFIDNQVDRATGTIRLKATFANGGSRLWPGQFVQVRLTLGTQAGVVVIPAAAVQAGQKSSGVFVLKADKTVELRAVVTHAADTPDSVVVESGIAAGETVVVDGQLGLTNGTAVQVKAARGEESAPAAVQP
jgi:multidrug efflux system membrane fusion protein